MTFKLVFFAVSDVVCRCTGSAWLEFQIEENIWKFIEVSFLVMTSVW